MSGTIAAAAMCGLVQIGNLTVPEVSDDTATSTTYRLDTSAPGTYTDGVYTGAGMGFRGNTEVQVTVENGNITDITILSYEDDPEFFQEAESSIIDQILSRQSVDVQAVSGATFSSNGIIAAVANALGIEQQTGSSGSEPATEEENGFSSGPSDSSENEGESEQPDADPEQKESAALDLSALADGTYQGEGEGFRGTTSVSVTVENGSITDITITSYADDEQFFSRAATPIIADIIDTQSLDVACVSGATFSSNGILEAVANALNVEFDNPNQSSSHKGGHRGGRFGR